MGVPFPAALEVILMEISFELLREAGVRLPGAMGNTIGIVGGLIIGQAAVDANLVSPIVVIVVAFTALCSFSIPNEEFAFSFRILKFYVIVLSAWLGFFGFLIALLTVFIHLSRLESFGIPYLMPFVGESTLILPSQLAAFAGNDGLASIVLGGIMGSLYLWYLAYVLKKMETDLVTYMERILPTWMKKIFLVLLLVYFTGMAGYGAYIFSDVIQKGLIAGESFPLILILVLLTAGYAVCGGIESRARVYEILFVVLFVLLAGMLLIAAGDLEMEYLYGFFQADTGSVMKGSLAVFFCLMPLFLLAFFPSYVQKAKWGKLVHAVHAAMWFAIGVLAVLYVILLGSFGSRSLTTMKYPAITLMSSIHLRGSFLKRLDAFMIAIWFFTLFALVTVFLFYAQELVQKLRKKDTHKKWYLCGVMAAVFGVAEMLHQSSHGEWFRDYLLYIGIPLFLFLPLFVLLWGKGKKRHEG